MLEEVREQKQKKKICTSVRERLEKLEHKNKDVARNCMFVESISSVL